LEQVLSADIPAPSRVRPELPTALDAVLASALERDPDRRMESAQAFAQAMSDVLQEHASLGQPESVSEVVRVAAGSMLAARRSELQRHLDGLAHLLLPGRGPDEATAALPAPPSTASLNHPRQLGVAPPPQRSRPRWAAALLTTGVVLASTLYVATRSTGSARERLRAVALATPKIVAAASSAASIGSITSEELARPSSAAPNVAIVAQPTARSRRPVSAPREKTPDKAPPNPYRDRVRHEH
jgi:serine/threonine-protein kinase